MNKKAMTEARPAAGDLAQLERLIAALRPKLHRYCARITGSVIDGEDVMLIRSPSCSAVCRRSRRPRRCYTTHWDTIGIEHRSLVHEPLHVIC